jgi:CHAT domain-containing protein
MAAKRVVLAEYFTAIDKTLLFVVCDNFDEPRIVEINVPLEEIRQFVDTHFDLREHGSRVHNLDLYEWQTRFGPFVDPILHWTEEGDIIWFVLHDVLHYLPFHALQVNGRYLIERNPICYTPSASVMSFCHAKRKGKREKALVVGDSRNDLLYAYEESLTVAKLFSTQPYVRGQATKALVKEMLEKKHEELDILHFSCHGQFDTKQALKSCIVLAPEENDNAEGKNNEQWNLTAEEIFSLSMNAELVTLSACETGVNKHKPGDELIGLTRALIYAGTPSVIVSLWAVDDLSTGLLMQHFYQLLQLSSTENNADLITKVEALQSAQMYVKNLTAQQVVNYCNQHLAELGRSENPERALGFQLGQAKAQISASDLASAIDTCRVAQNQLSASTSEWARKMASQVREMLDLLEFSAEESLEDPTINYKAKPFKHPYYWAPFILVGDWK